MATAIAKTIIYRRLGLTPEQLVAFCNHWQVTELALFGSILRDDFHTSSDIDILVSYQPQAQRGLLEKVAMKEELESLVNRKVDLVSKKAIAHIPPFEVSHSGINDRALFWKDFHGLAVQMN